MLESDKILATRLVASTEVTQLNQFFVELSVISFTFYWKHWQGRIKLLVKVTIFSVFSKYNDIEFLFVENASRPSKTMLAK